MAYTAPAFDEVDFDFVDDGYTPASGAFILVDMAGGGVPAQTFFFQQIYTVGPPPIPVPNFFFQQIYKVILDSALPPPIYPLEFSYNTVSTIRYFTEIIANRGGFEQRNITWPIPLLEFDLTQDVETWEDLNKIASLFKTTKGKELTFIIKDPFDFKSTLDSLTITDEDQFVDIGDGVTQIFNLKKTYSTGNLSQVLDIKYPDVASVSVAVDGTPTVVGVDPNDGRLFFTVAPIDGAIITAGYEFYRRVRFDSETLSIALDNYKNGDTSLNVTEVRD